MNKRIHCSNRMCVDRSFTFSLSGNCFCFICLGAVRVCFRCVLLLLSSLAACDLCDCNYSIRISVVFSSFDAETEIECRQDKSEHRHARGENETNRSECTRWERWIVHWNWFVCCCWWVFAWENVNMFRYNRTMTTINDNEWFPSSSFEPWIRKTNRIQTMWKRKCKTKRMSFALLRILSSWTLSLSRVKME